MMQFDILTLFPEVLEPYLSGSILGRAQERGVFSCKLHQIREHAIDPYGHVDDTLYGGGTGMLMRPEPIYESWQEAVEGAALAKAKRLTLFLSPKGRLFTQELAREFARYDQIILLCGHYEGVDQRVLDEIVDEEVSVGDYVLTGGELASLIVIDATSRMLEGTLPDKSAYENESHYNGLLEARQYTRPPVWRGRTVPDVLLGGHHEQQEQYRHLDALNETLEKRPDLFDQYDLSQEELEKLLRYRRQLPKNTTDHSAEKK